MGRRLQGAALRAKKRATQEAQEQLDTIANKVETQDVVNKPNDELFVIDTNPDLPSTKQLAKKEKKRKSVKHASSSSSMKEQKQIQKLIDTHTAEELNEMVNQQKKKQQQSNKRAKIQRSVKPTFDLWENDDDNNNHNENKKEDTDMNISAKTNTKEKKNSNTKKKDEQKNQQTTSISSVINPGIGPTLAGIKPEKHSIVSKDTSKQRSLSSSSSNNVNSKNTVSIDIAKSGQSYNPDSVLHNQVLASAMQVEERRIKAEEEAKAPISTGLSEETKALLLDDSDSDDDTDDENDKESEKANNNSNDDDDDDRMIVTKKINSGDKLTRAQRNKQKRVRAEQKELNQQRKEKKLQKSIGEVQNITKQLKQKEADTEQKKKLLRQLKQSTERIKGKNIYQQLSAENPIDAPTIPVALKSELLQVDDNNNGGSGSNGGSSLRRMKPKGSLISDRMNSLLDRDMIPKKQSKTKRRIEGKKRQRVKRKMKIRGKGYDISKDGMILG